MSEKKMSVPDLSDLFTPGDGGVPPYLAGRKEEQAYFQACVKSLKNKKPAHRNLILYGPRGNGKTALLRYLQKETRQQGASNPDILWTTPGMLVGPGKLVDLIIGEYSALRNKIQSAGFSINVGIAKADAQIDLSKRTLTLDDLLQERCQHQPLILIIDEAHRLGPELGEDLLNASQIVRNAGNPFLLVLAGTPNLEATLGKANASFWDRSKKFPLGRLSPDEAGAALTVPLQEAGITFAPGVVAEIVAQAHCYPFFMQVWGDCLARRLDETKETEITLAQVKEVEAAVINERNAMYDIRFNEIKRMGLLSIARSVADAFVQCEEPVLHGSDLDQAIEKGMAGDEPTTNERIMEKLEQLFHLGYIWPAGEYDYEPGIQSLMAFVQGYSLSQTRGKEAALHTTPR